MENREQQILAEIKSLMSSVRMQLERLDAKMAELQQVYEPQEYSLGPFDVSLDDVAMIAGGRESVLESASDIPETVVPQQAVIDVMTARQAWKTDMPGSPVKDVRAAIALVDRALFINKLFGGDAASFMEAVNAVNQMTALQQVEEYMVAHHPEWDFDSDVVYRFMMAVRRKVN